MHAAIAGGGTGGHFFPALTFAHYLREKGLKITFIGTKRGIEYRKRELLKDFSTLFLDIKKFKNQSLLTKLTYPLSLLRNLGELKAHFGKDIPDFSTVFGGYTSVPLGVFTRINRKPLFVHEQNSIPGMGNRYLSKLSKVVFITFPYAERFFKNRRVVLSGLPIRKEVKEAKNLNREQILKKLGLEDRFTLTVIGGSQGAKTLNGLALELAQRLDLQIIHLCGERHYETLKKEYEKVKPRARVKLLPFYLNMGEIFKITDFAISRSGASTSFELSYFGIPTIFVPYPYAVYDHQYYNALYFVEGKGAYLFREDELKTQKVLEIVENHLKDEKLQREYSQRMERLFIPQAEKKMWETIEEFV